MAGAVPAQQGLVAGDPSRARVHQRLEVDIHRLAGQRIAKIGFEIGAQARILFHPHLEEARAAAALGLGAIKRELGILHQDSRINAVGRRHGDADAAAGENVLAQPPGWQRHDRSQSCALA